MSEGRIDIGVDPRKGNSGINQRLTTRIIVE